LNGLNVPKFQLVVASAQFLFASKCYARFFCFELDKKRSFNAVGDGLVAYGDLIEVSRLGNRRN